MTCPPNTLLATAMLSTWANRDGERFRVLKLGLGLRVRVRGLGLLGCQGVMDRVKFRLRLGAIVRVWVSVMVRLRF